MTRPGKRPTAPVRRLKPGLISRVSRQLLTGFDDQRENQLRCEPVVKGGEMNAQVDVERGPGDGIVPDVGRYRRSVRIRALLRVETRSDQT